MVLDISIDEKSLTLQIENPRRPALDEIFKDIERFIDGNSIKAKDMDLKGLIPRMIRGVAGCESGCPADAKELVLRGYGGAELKYIDGGILSALLRLDDGRLVSLKLFPDF